MPLLQSRIRLNFSTLLQLQSNASFDTFLIIMMSSATEKLRSSNRQTLDCWEEEYVHMSKTESRRFSSSSKRTPLLASIAVCCRLLQLFFNGCSVFFSAQLQASKHRCFCYAASSKATQLKNAVVWFFDNDTFSSSEMIMIDLTYQTHKHTHSLLRTYLYSMGGLAGGTTSPIPFNHNSLMLLGLLPFSSSCELLCFWVSF